jgi:hypothetical protein
MMYGVRKWLCSGISSYSELLDVLYRHQTLVFSCQVPCVTGSSQQEPISHQVTLVILPTKLRCDQHQLAFDTASHAIGSSGACFATHQ